MNGHKLCKKEIQISRSIIQQDIKVSWRGYDAKVEMKRNFESLV